jgi:hypothetical protein
MINCFGPKMSHLTIVGAAAHLVGKCGSVLMTSLLGQTGGTGMPAAAVSPTIDRSVTLASAASSITAAALIVATLIASTLIPTTLITAGLLVAAILLVLALVALLVLALVALLVAANALIRYLRL